MNVLLVGSEGRRPDRRPDRWQPLPDEELFDAQLRRHDVRLLFDGDQKLVHRRETVLLG
jgi:hypothetical protein